MERQSFYFLSGKEPRKDYVLHGCRRNILGQAGVCYVLESSVDEGAVMVVVESLNHHTLLQVGEEAFENIGVGYFVGNKM